VTSAIDVEQKFQLQWQSSLSNVRDTDVAKATTDLSEENLSQQAAMQAQASLPRNSLFDFLK
jgi:flagellin-like hook-associated protein FlgL